MPAPTVTFPTTGTDPKTATKAGVEAEINGALLDLHNDIQTRATAASVAALATTVTGKASQEDFDALEQRVVRAGSQQGGRPGDNPGAFAGALVGAANDLDAISGSVVVDADFGNAVQIQGAAIIAARHSTPLLPARIYRARFAVKRTVQSVDPFNDAVRFGLQWLDANGDAISQWTSDVSIFVATGAYMSESRTFSRSASGVDVTAPAGARYARPFVQTYGTSPTTLVSVVAFDDITEASVVDDIAAAETAAAIAEAAQNAAQLSAAQALAERTAAGNSASVAASEANAAAVSTATAKAASEASGTFVFYDTKAAADAAFAGLANNQIVEIGQDETRAGRRTRYRKEGTVYSFKYDYGPQDGVMRGNADAVAPAFVDTLWLTRANSNWPGLVTGSWNVTGTAGSATLTRTGGTAMASLTQGNLDGTFAVALVSDDGSQGFTAICVGNNGSSEIYLREPLAKDFVGVLTSWGDAANGQHLTQNATRVWARNVAEATEFECCLGQDFGLGFPLIVQNPAPWALNASLNAAPSTDGGTFPDRISKGVQNNATAMNIVATGGLGSYPAIPRTAQAGRHTIGMWLAGHGVTFRTNCRGKNVFLSGWIGATHPVRNLNTFYAPSGVQIRTRVIQDGRVVYDDTQNHVLKPLRLKLFGAGDVQIEISLVGNTPINLELADWSLREAGTGGKLIKAGQRVLFGLDSWGAFYGETDLNGGGSVIARRGQFAREISRLTGCTIIDMSEGGRTGQWVLAWLERWIDLYNPDVFVTNMFINDMTLTASWTVTGPTGATVPAYVGVGLIPEPNGNLSDTQKYWEINRNMRRMQEICQRRGVRLIYIRPGAVPSGVQTQVLAGGSPYLGHSSTGQDMVTEIAADFTNAHSPLNESGKYPGRRAWHSGLSAAYVSTGHDRTSAWARQDDPTVTITPTDTRAPSIISRSTVSVKTAVALVFALEADEDVTWTITGGADQALFSLGAILNNRQRMLVLPAQTLGAPADADLNNTYIVQVTATDQGGNATNQTVTVTVVA